MRVLVHSFVLGFFGHKLGWQIPLKKCLSRDNLQNDDSHIYENVEIIKNGTEASSTTDANNEFLEEERKCYETVNGCNTQPVDNCKIYAFDCESAQIEIETEPSLNTLPSSCLNDADLKSVKDRMFLSSEDASCLLFTQTVTSPMLTPSEESIDFLKGFQEETTENTNLSNGKPTDDNIYENVDVLHAQVKESTCEFIENEKEHCEVIEHKTLNESINGELEELKSVNIVKQINQIENTEVTNVCSNVNISTVTESHIVETTTEVRSTGETNGFKKKKSKKSKSQHEKENISVKSSFSKFDALQKKNILNSHAVDQDTDACKKCGRPVFQMERVVAEKSIWHRNCFRCVECSKQLLVDNFESHEGILYCKPHFKALFQPKAVENDAPSKPHKHELIIRENQPVELPPDVARASDKPDLGLEELHSLNVKERFQVFENVKNPESNFEKNSVKMERSQSILSKLARFQAKGMNVGVSDDSLNGVPVEGSSEEEDVEEEVDGDDADLIRAKRVQKEKPFHFLQMSDVKSKWEQGNQQKRDDLREERKQEIQTIRSRLFLGKQGKMKEAYQQAIVESETNANVKKEVPVEVTDTRSIKDKFERGDVASNEIKKESEDMSIFESGISKKSRSIFLELDAGNVKAPKISPTSPIKVSTSVRSARESKTPERDVCVDVDIVRSDEVIEDSVIAKSTHTATKMLNKFREMEENLLKGQEPQGPKPLKRFTPPREPLRRDSSSEQESGSEDDVDNTKIVEHDLIEAQKAARAQKLRAKFERWEQNEIKRENSVNLAEEIGEDQSQIETAKSLCAKFESLRDSSVQTQSSRVKVNRFV
ncbi:hypothetical protein RN001_010641 [Aquatica leii]|uniref:LIM zinc-binding domain-containing protein n=1 Tax=Aquatica leii TaxID=1421715 RepID=A0AAN7Q3F7_9COLE|nr:hypothetical protein RN001_010641 [Aquatica leii]